MSTLLQTRTRTGDSDQTVHETAPPPPPFSGSFWDKTPEASRSRAIYFRLIMPGLVLLTVTIFGTLSIYWGALWRTDDFIGNLNGCIIDFDGSTIGNAVVQTFTAQNGQPNDISWELKPVAEFPNGFADVESAVVHERCWVALAVLPNATARLEAAAVAMDTSYDGASVVNAYAAEARNEDAYRFLLKPNVDIPMDLLALSFSNQFARELATQGQVNITALMMTAPQIITRPVFFNLTNLRPFDVPVASAVTFVGLIYLLIISFIVALVCNGARLASGLERRLSLRSLIVTRLVTAITIYFFLSLFYSLQSLAFLLPVNRRFGRPGFLVFWMIEWFGMAALGLAVEAMLVVLTIRFIPFFLVLWIISNVSTCFYPLEALPSFYRYGYATPFYNVSRAVRTIVFGTRNMMGLNFGVLIAWIGISCLTLILFTWYSRRQQVKVAQPAKLG